MILTTIACPAQSLFGNFDQKHKGSIRRLVRQINDVVIELAEKYGATLLDVAALAERVGTENWFEPTNWNNYKLPFAPMFFDCYADQLGRVVGAIRGKSKKCLVLDLDNTLWAGIVGDDGVAGLKIGEGSPLGEAHMAVQKLALGLKKRG